MRRALEVWFYIGVLLAFYGVMLTAAGLYQWRHPPATVLADIHATFWVGVLLLLAGMVYVVAYWPKRGSGSPHDGSRVV